MQEEKTGRTGRAIDPKTGKEIYEPWAGYVPEDGVKPGDDRPEGVPHYANYWEPKEGPDAAPAQEDGEPAPPKETACACGKTYSGTAKEIENKLRGHKLTCKKAKE